MSIQTYKTSGKERRRLARLRERAYTETSAFIDGEETWTARQKPKDPMLKLTQKLESYTAGRLVRFIKQSARRAASAKYILVGLHSDSVFRPAIEQQQKFNIIAFLAASTELDSRGKTDEAPR
jgi:hypothetical protein